MPPAADAEGCTTVLVGQHRSADGALLASQTWDLNPQDVDDVIAVYRRPETGPATLVGDLQWLSDPDGDQ